MKEIILAVTVILITAVYASSQHKCELMDEDVICQCQGYNLTYFPNDRYTSQVSAKLQFTEFKSLIGTKCSPYLVMFLCSRYFPPCRPEWYNFKYVQPCRELCEKVRSDCEPILHQYGAKWSKELSCDSLQSINTTKSSGIPCISPESMQTEKNATECKTKEKCIDIDHEKGKSASYKTFFPNGVTGSQANASQRLNEMLKMNCSQEAEQFFILTHYPPCTEINSTVQLAYPCKQLCRRIKKECGNQLGSKMTWPKDLDCSKLSKEGCVNDVSGYFVEPLPTTSTTASTPAPIPTPSSTPLKSCEQFIETSCDELNNFADLPKVTFPEYKSTFAQYVKLLNSSCSVWLKPFLCYEAFVAYKSTDSSKRVKPCKNVCRKAEKECSNCFANHGLSWSDHWNCQDFQVKKDCIGINDLDSYSSSKSFDSSDCPATSNGKVCTP